MTLMSLETTRINTSRSTYRQTGEAKKVTPATSSPVHPCAPHAHAPACVRVNGLMLQRCHFCHRTPFDSMPSRWLDAYTRLPFSSAVSHLSSLDLRYIIEWSSPG